MSFYYKKIPINCKFNSVPMPVVSEIKVVLKLTCIQAPCVANSVFVHINFTCVQSIAVPSAAK